MNLFTFSNFFAQLLNYAVEWLAENIDTLDCFEEGTELEEVRYPKIFVCNLDSTFLIFSSARLEFLYDWKVGRGGSYSHEKDHKKGRKVRQQKSQGITQKIITFPMTGNNHLPHMKWKQF